MIIFLFIQKECRNLCFFIVKNAQVHDPAPGIDIVFLIPVFNLQDAGRSVLRDLEHRIKTFRLYMGEVCDQ